MKNALKIILVVFLTSCSTNNLSSSTEISSSLNQTSASSVNNDIESKKEISKIDLIELPYRLDYFVGENFESSGSKVMITYNDNTSEILKVDKSLFTFKYKFDQPGKHVVNIKYKSFLPEIRIDVNVLDGLTNSVEPFDLLTNNKLSSLNHYFVQNLSNFDFSSDNKYLYDIVFHNYTAFPKSSNLPSWFNQDAILQWGREPVLNIKKIHEMGITGKGVNVAYIDFGANYEHESIKNKENLIIKPIVYNGITSVSEMHGNSVIDLIIGEGIGAAPDVNLYYFSHPGYLGDQNSHAQAILEVLNFNETLPNESKIKVIGFSDNIDSSEKNKQQYIEAVNQANSLGIVVYFADFSRFRIYPMQDRSNPGNYRLIYSTDSLKVGFPVTYTLANRFENDAYTYYPEGGTSWITPVVVSLAALALQVYPNINPFMIEKIMYDTAYEIDNIHLINPVAFIEELIRLKNIKHQDYFTFVLNSSSLDNNDINAIAAYKKSLESEDIKVVVFDVKAANNFDSIYQTLKDYYFSNPGQNLGIQIFGTNNEVSAYKLKDEVEMGELYGKHLGSVIITDFFYSNFHNNINLLNQDLTLEKIYREELKINFIPQWEVSRLPLLKGQYQSYFEKYYDYLIKTNNEKHQLVNFSNPIFSSDMHTDDYSYFIKERLVDEFNFLEDDKTTIYGNLIGKFPINTDVVGGFTKENLALENEKQIMNLVINSHGQEGNIDKAFYDVNTGQELRESFVNNSNINEILNSNYYNLYQWTCWGVADLNEKNLVFKMLSEGLAINVIAGSYVESNNGMNVYQKNLDFLGNNGISIFYSLIEGIYQNNLSWSESIFYAKKRYIIETLKNKKYGEGNYQFNLMNSIVIHYLGLINRDLNISELIKKENDIQQFNDLTIKIYDKNKNNATNNQITSGSLTQSIEFDPTLVIDSKQAIISELNNAIWISKETENYLEYTDDGIEYSKLEITYISVGTSKMLSAFAAQDEENYYIKFQFINNLENNVNIFFAGDAPGLKTFTSRIYTNPGLVILRIPKSTQNINNVNIIVNLLQYGSSNVDNFYELYTVKRKR